MSRNYFDLFRDSWKLASEIFLLVCLCIFFCFANSALASFNNDSLLGYWKFDGDGNDSSGDGCTVNALNLASYNSSKPTTVFPNSQSLNFSGNGSSATFACSQTHFQPSNQLTFSLWVSLPVSLGSTGSVIGGNYNSVSSNYGYYFKINDNTVTFALGNGGSYGSATFSYSMPLNTWVHLAGTWDHNAARLYINGVSVASAPFTQTLAYSSASFQLGNFYGRVDDMRLYSRALSASEISDLGSGHHTSASWIGGASSDYDIASNWNTGSVPDPYTLVTITTATPQPNFVSSPEEVSGLIINSGATLNLFDKNLIVHDSGTFSNNGTLKLWNDSINQSLAGFVNDTDSGTVEISPTAAVTGLKTGYSYYDLIINPSTSVAITLTANLQVNGSLTLQNGALNASSSGLGINLKKDWIKNNGSFNPGNSTVTLSGGDQMIKGSNSFYNLTKAVSTASTLTFEGGSTQAISHNLILQGAGSSSQFLSLLSSVPGTQWNLYPTTGTMDVSGLDIQDSYNHGSDVTLPGRNKNSGNNLGWLFDTEPPSVSLNSVVSLTKNIHQAVVGTAAESATFSTIVSSVEYQMEATSGTWSTCVANVVPFDSASETFTCTPTTLADGSHIMYIRAADMNGNISTPVSASFTVDNTFPASGSIVYTDGYYTTASVELTVDDGADTVSGINTSSRIVQRKSATLLSDGTCGTFGSFSAISPTGNHPNFTDDTVISGNCYQYRYLVSDVADNQGIYTSSNIVKVDTLPPAGGSIAYTDGYYTTASVGLTVDDGADATLLVNPASRIVQRKSATLSDGTCGSFGSFSAIIPSGTYPNFVDSTVVSDNCYQYRYLVSDMVDNQVVYASANLVKVDTIVPVIAESTPVPVHTADSTPSYIFSSTEAGAITYSGVCSSATTNATAGNNTIVFSTLADGDYDDCTIRVTDVANNQSSLLDVSDFTVDTVAPSLSEITPVTNPTGDSSPDYTFHSDEAGPITYGGDCVAGSSSAALGNNTINFNTLADGTHTNCTIQVTDAVGNMSTLLDIADFTVDTISPVLAEITAITTPTTDATPAYVFSSTEAGAITYSGGCSSATTNATAGNNTIVFNTLADGSHNSCTIRVTDATSNQSLTLPVTNFTVAAPPLISSVSVDESSSAATIHWTTDEVATSMVDYGLSNTYGVSTTEADVATPVTIHGVALSGLSSCTTYHYRVRSKDGSSNEAIDTDRTFKTTGCTETCSDGDPDKPDLDEAKALDSSSIKIYYNDSEEEVDHYELKYGIASENYEWSVDDIGGKNEEDYLIKELKSGTTYYFKIRAVNDCGKSDWTSEVSATTDKESSTAIVAEQIPADGTTPLPVIDTVTPNTGEVPTIEMPLVSPDSSPAQLQNPANFENAKESSVTPSDKLDISTVEMVKKNTGKKIKIGGKGPPNTRLTVYIYSDPIVLTVETDSDGNWSYVLDKDLEEGEHMVYVAVTDDDGKIVEKSAPFAFVKTAEAATRVDAASAMAGQETSPIKKAQAGWLNFIIPISVVSLILALMAIGWHFKRQREENTISNIQ